MKSHPRSRATGETRLPCEKKTNRYGRRSVDRDVLPAIAANGFDHPVAMRSFPPTAHKLVTVQSPSPQSTGSARIPEHPGSCRQAGRTRTQRGPAAVKLPRSIPPRAKPSDPYRFVAHSFLRGRRLSYFDRAAAFTAARHAPAPTAVRFDPAPRGGVAGRVRFGSANCTAWNISPTAFAAPSIRASRGPAAVRGRRRVIPWGA